MFKNCLSFSLAIFLLLILLTACGRDNPLAPGNGGEPQDTVANGEEPDNLESSAIEIFALAPGASWKYDFMYNKINSNLMHDISIYHFGTFSFNVKKANIQDGRFLIETVFYVDSLYYHIKIYDAYPVVGLDTSFTLYSGVDTTLSFSDSTMEYSLVMARDTLWYEKSDSLEFMMPRKFIHNCRVNFKFFNYPGSDKFNFFLVDGHQTDTGFKFGIHAQFFIEVSFLKEKGGLDLLKATWCGGTIEYSREELVYELIEYVPGQL